MTWPAPIDQRPERDRDAVNDLTHARACDMLAADEGDGAVTRTFRAALEALAAGDVAAAQVFATLAVAEELEWVSAELGVRP